MHSLDDHNVRCLGSWESCPEPLHVAEAPRRESMSNRLIAHLAHVEVLTTTPEESLRFFRDVIGLEESGRAGQSVYLRGWGEWSHHSVQLTEAPQPGLGHVGWRTWSPEDLEAAIAKVDAAGTGEGWCEDAVGHGRAYRYRGPGGQVHELFYDDERFVPPAGMESPYPDRPQRYVPRGIYPRMIDHVTVMTDDPVRDAEWYRDTLGYTFTEYTVLPHADIPVFAMVTNNEKSHDLGLILDQSGVAGRVHHIAFWVDSREELLRAAEWGSKPTPAVTACTSPTGRRSAGIPTRARTSSTATSTCPTR